MVLTVDLGSLDDLDLSDLDVLDGEDLLDLVGDLLVHHLGGEGLEDLGDVAFVHFLVDDLDDLSPDLLDLGGEGVGGVPLLPLDLSGEGGGEHSEDVAVVGLHVADGLDQGPPLLDGEALVVPGGVEPVE